MSSLNDPSSWPALESLRFEVPSANLDTFVAADKATWTAFLSTQDGFGGKLTTFNTTANATVEVFTYVMWESYDLWKSIDPSELMRTNQEFAEAYGPNAPTPTPIPGDDHGLAIYNKDGSKDGCMLASNIGNTVCSQQGVVCDCDNTSEEETYLTVIIVLASAAVIFIPMLTLYVMYLHRLIDSEKLLSSDRDTKANPVLKNDA